MGGGCAGDTAHLFFTYWKANLMPKKMFSLNRDFNCLSMFLAVSFCTVDKLIYSFKFFSVNNYVRVL